MTTREQLERLMDGLPQAPQPAWRDDLFAIVHNEKIEAAAAGRRVGVQDVEIMILRQYEAALKAGDEQRLSDLKTAVRIVRELFPDLLERR